MIKETILGLAIAAVIASTVPAVAAPIQFKSDPASADYKIVAGMFADYLKRFPAALLETSVVDLDGKGIGSIIARVRSPATCTQTACHTTVFGFRGNTWVTMMERKAAVVEIGNPSTAPGGNKLRDIVIDGHEIWSTTNGNTYLPKLESVGTVVRATRPAETAAAAAAIAALGRDSKDTPGTPANLAFRWLGVEVAASPAYKAIWVRGESATGCGVIGCPSALVIQSGGRWKAVLTTFSLDSVGLLPSLGKLDFKDIAVSTPDGYTVMRFDGQEYRPVATSFASALTPVP